MGALTKEELYVQRIAIPGGVPSASYLAHLPVIQNLQQMGGLDFTNPVTFLVGENGVGKSTLVEALAVAVGFNPEGGTVNFNFSTRSTHSSLNEYLRITKSYKRWKDGFFLRAESFYNVASNIDDLDAEPGFGDPIIVSYGGKSLHNQSHGESFMALVENRFRGKGLYILDEPEAALSPMRLMALMMHIGRLIEDESQFVISTHSPILMAFPGADVLQITEEGITHVDYHQTEHFQITRRFLENPERMMKWILGEQTISKNEKCGATGKCDAAP